MDVMKEDNNPYGFTPLTSEPPFASSMAPFPGRTILASFLVMLPWPVLGILACVGLSLFEKPSEAVLLFGGVTLFFLIPVALIVSAEWILGVLIGIVWVIAALLPLWFGKRHGHARISVATLLIFQSVFSAFQAGLGFLLVIGKQV